MTKRKSNNIFLQLIMAMLLLFLPYYARGQKKGVLINAKGEKYEGELYGKKPHGKGKIIYRSGDSYEGEFEKGKRHGYGVYTFTDGERYEGSWHQDHQHGRGVYFFANKDKYDGLWYMDFQQGFGTMYYHNGDVYKGDWYQDHRNGRGIYTYASGATYVGEWKNDKKEGKGTLTKENGEIIEGLWINDELSVPQGFSSNVSKEWYGTGFALIDGYIVTNFHVTYDAKSIEVWGINGNFTKGYKANVIGTDKAGDLSLLKITDDEFMGYGIPPYAFQSSMVDVGENIYVLGYPLIQTMGEEIKLTNGIVSSRSGYEGDVTTYQISAPVQPGNSGGPMLDMDGNIVGVICAKHREAENANYAIKMSYLKNLVESVVSSEILPTNSTLKGKELKEQVKLTKNYVYIIKCSK